jgi:hypothetical protein
VNSALNVMASESHNVSRALASAARVAVACGVAFFILDMSAAFLVTGDGRASGFTYFMLALTEVPINLFGLNRQGTIFSAPIFWGVVSGVGMFVYILLRPAKDHLGAK